MRATVATKYTDRQRMTKPINPETLMNHKKIDSRCWGCWAAPAAPVPPEAAAGAVSWARE